MLIKLSRLKSHALIASEGFEGESDSERKFKVCVSSRSKEID